ncbi:FMN-binding protein [Geoanaerobacter pelophilus]|uniref:FMN-binding protein n=1 Tax=Geoanaerobacter pelophilus TaxID=60036 RepID=A0ABQ0MMC5_9BACT|nr:pyridoxamine 5'-phosphate oxidase family protein [Geoanaerobacter pelophilus]GAW68099.1 FMN-binding protein [Geoanaerobacter pelophilus]
MFSEKLLAVMKHPGVVAIATQWEEGPHLVNTWNSYLQLPREGCLLIPAGYMHHTEANIARDNRVLLTIGSHEVAGNLGPGTGFLLKGTAAFVTSGPDFDTIKAKYAWARGALVVSVESVTQTL